MFNARRFLDEHFGDVDRLLAFIRVYGFEPPHRHAVAKWFGRSAIPGAWLPVLLALLELENGQPLKLAAYLEGATNVSGRE